MSSSQKCDGFAAASRGKPEDGACGDEHIDPGRADGRRVGGRYAAVDLEALVVPQEWAYASCLVEDFGDEGLAAETWVDAHDEDEVEVFDEAEEAFDGGGGVDGEAGGRAEFADVFGEFEGLVGCVGGGHGFDVDGEVVGPGLDKGFEVVLRVHDHQVDIERDLGECTAEAAAHVRPHGEIGNEVAVHDIEVKKVGPGVER